MTLPALSLSWILRRVLLAVAFCSVPMGCAHAAREIAHTATPTVVASAADELKRPEALNALDAVARSPAGQHLGYGVGVGVGRGLADELLAIAVGGGVPPDANATQPAAMPTTGADWGQRVQAFTRQNIAPAVNHVVQEAVQTAMKSAMTPQVRDQAGAMAQTVGDGLVKGIGQATQRDIIPAVERTVREQLAPQMQGLRDQLRPALHDILEKDVGPMIRATMDDAAADALVIPTRPEVQPAVVKNARNLSLGASYGTHDGLVSLGLMSESGKLPAHVRVILWGSFVVVAVIAILLLIFMSFMTLFAMNMWRHRKTVWPVARGAV